MEGPKLPPRATRGKRMHAVMQEEQDADEEFWNQDAFLEDEQDDEYEEEEVPEDVVDSDFDKSESDEDDETPEEDTERRKPRRAFAPPGSKRPSSQAKTNINNNKKKKAEAEALAAAAEQEASTPSKLRPRKVRFVDEHAGKGDGEEDEGQDEDGGGEKGEQQQQQQAHKQEAAQPQLQRRASRRTAVLEKAAEREQKQREAPKTPVKKVKPVAPERRLTQEEMLQEAAQTEVQNLASLEYLLAVEEEIKKKATVKKNQYTGPLIRYHSKNGFTTLEFEGVEPELFASRALPYAKQAVCAVTGLPAKYRDPKTGAPYATLEAFKILRERLRVRDEARRMEQQSAIARKRTRLDAAAGGRRSPSPGPSQLPSSLPLAAGRVTPPPPPLSHMKPVVYAAGKGPEAHNTPLSKSSTPLMQAAAVGGKAVTPSPLRVVQSGAALAASPLAHASLSPARPQAHLLAQQPLAMHQSDTQVVVEEVEPGRPSQAASCAVGEHGVAGAVVTASVSAREQEAVERSMDFDELFHSDLGLIDAADVLDSRPP